MAMVMLLLPKVMQPAHGLCQQFNDCNDNNLPPYLVTLNGVCYATIESALAAAVPAIPFRWKAISTQLASIRYRQALPCADQQWCQLDEQYALTNNGTITEVGTGSFVNGPMGLYRNRQFPTVPWSITEL